MRETLYLAWCYLRFHRYKTALLVASVALILYVPAGLRVLVEQSSRQLTARAEATPLLIGAPGSALELVLGTLYFGSEPAETLRYAEVEAVQRSGLALAIPVHARFEAREQPIVGTSLDYFGFRGLEVDRGRMLALLGECVVGHRAAERLGVEPGDSVVSSPETVFDLAGVYPLKMRVVGVLAPSDTADDDAIFVDVRTAWIIQGLGHGHEDLSRPEAASSVLRRESGGVVANASVVEFNEIDAENVDAFHFHGDLGDFPLTALVAVPPDARSSTLLQGRYQGADQEARIVRPVQVMNELLATILKVQSFVLTGAVILGGATLAVVFTVFGLSLRLRRREITTLHRIGGSRWRVLGVTGAEIVGVLLGGVMLAAALTWCTEQFGAELIRVALRSWA